MSYYIVVCSYGDTYATIEPIEEPGDDRARRFPVGFAWTEAEHEAVRFTSKYHAHAVAELIGASYREVKS